MTVIDSRTLFQLAAIHTASYPPAVYGSDAEGDAPPMGFFSAPTDPEPEPEPAPEPEPQPLPEPQSVVDEWPDDDEPD